MAKKRERGEGSIGNVPGGKFLYIWYYDNAGKQHRESTRSTLKQVAREQLNARLAAMGRGERSPMRVKSIRYEDMRSILLNDYKRKGIATEKLILVDDKPTGLRGTGIKFLDAFFKGMRVQQIDTDVLQSYRDSRTKEGTGETTVNRDIALLRRMMVLTVRQKKLQFTMPYFPMTSEAGNERTAFVTPVKFRDLLDAMPENLRPATLFFFETGCRQGARKKIIWSWVKLDEGVIDIPGGVTKNDKPTILPLSDELVRMLRKQFRNADDPVFDTANMRKAFQAACVKVGLGVMTGPKVWQYRGMSEYSLRHSAVRNMTRAGARETVAMSISGHKTRSVFDRYNITDTNDVKEAMQAVVRYNTSLMQVAVASKS